MTYDECALMICDGSGWLEIVDFTGGVRERCPCNIGNLPDVVERCSCCLRRVGLGHSRWCDFHDGEPGWPDEWVEVDDPQVVASAEDRYLNAMIGEQ